MLRGACLRLRRALLSRLLLGKALLLLLRRTLLLLRLALMCLRLTTRGLERRLQILVILRRDRAAKCWRCGRWWCLWSIIGRKARRFDRRLQIALILLRDRAACWSRWRRRRGWLLEKHVDRGAEVAVGDGESGACLLLGEAHCTYLLDGAHRWLCWLLWWWEGRRFPFIRVKRV